MERFDVVEQEQLAAQIVALMDAHFQRPTVEQKIRILNLAHQQISPFSPRESICEEGLSRHQDQGVRSR